MQGLEEHCRAKHFLDLGILAVWSSLAFSIRRTVFIQDYMIIHRSSYPNYSL